jgi:hypothetical protein
MKKKNTLGAGLKAAAGRKVERGVVVVSHHVPGGTMPETKEVFIGGQWSPEVRKTLKLCEAYTGRRLKPLLSEAINMLCAKYGLPEPCSAEEVSGKR